MDSVQPRRVVVLVAMAATVLAMLMLRLFPPTQYGFYPACPFRLYLGILCPGCGATHALAALLRGQLREAFHENALFVLLLPFAAAYAFICVRRALHHAAFRWPRVPTFVVYGLLVIAAVFTIVRNV